MLFYDAPLITFLLSNAFFLPISCSFWGSQLLPSAEERVGVLWCVCVCRVCVTHTVYERECVRAVRKEETKSNVYESRLPIFYRRVAGFRSITTYTNKIKTK